MAQHPAIDEEINATLIHSSHQEPSSLHLLSLQIVDADINMNNKTIAALKVQLLPLREQTKGFVYRIRPKSFLLLLNGYSYLYNKLYGLHYRLNPPVG